ncbi:uncharacterized protein LOC106478156 isoform X2 [Limulus polyphemus]|uniref:Uncharacterized protein LOC106478156 isoform X2 n=1 Tax=Limulus polyphemus TaxID=6850 RepID=A0ABM1C4R4_LIMPO|nr:uncharacterized protein LOC106478156 isoform X2 [Limulus polyphemus]
MALDGEVELEDGEDQNEPEKDETVKRGVHWTTNGFLMFCHRHFEIVRERYPHLDNGNITMVLQDWWSKLEPRERASYTEMAKQYEETIMNGQPNIPHLKTSSDTVSSKSLNKRALKLELYRKPCSGEADCTPNRGVTQSPLTPETPTTPLTVASPNGHLSFSKPPKKRYVQNGAFKPAVESDQDQLSADPQTSSACSALLELAEGCIPAASRQYNKIPKSSDHHSREMFSRDYSNHPYGLSRGVDKICVLQKRQTNTLMPMMEIDIASRIIDHAFSDKKQSLMSSNTVRKMLPQSPIKDCISISSYQTLHSPSGPTSKSSMSVLAEEPLNLCKRKSKTFQTSQQKIINHVVDKFLCGPFGSAGNDCLADSIIGKWQNQSQNSTLINTKENENCQNMAVKQTGGVNDSSSIQVKPKSPTHLASVSSEKDNITHLPSRLSGMDKSDDDVSSISSGLGSCEEVHVDRCDKKKQNSGQSNGHEEDFKDNAAHIVVEKNYPAQQRTIEEDYEASSVALNTISSEEYLHPPSESDCKESHTVIQHKVSTITDSETKLGVTSVWSKKGTTSDSLPNNRTICGVDCSSELKLANINETLFPNSCLEQESENKNLTSKTSVTQMCCLSPKSLTNIDSEIYKNNEEELSVINARKRNVSDISDETDTEKPEELEKDFGNDSDLKQNRTFTTQNDHSDLPSNIKKRKCFSAGQELQDGVTDSSNSACSLSDQALKDNTCAMNQNESSNEQENIKDDIQSTSKSNTSEDSQSQQNHHKDLEQQNDGQSKTQSADLSVLADSCTFYNEDETQYPNSENNNSEVT